MSISKMINSQKGFSTLCTFIKANVLNITCIIERADISENSIFLRSRHYSQWWRCY